MYQLKPFKQNIYQENEQLDGINNAYHSSNVFSITSRICKVCIETQNVLPDPDVCFI